MQLLNSTGWGTGSAPDLIFYLDYLRVNNMRGFKDVCLVLHCPHKAHPLHLSLGVPKGVEGRICSQPHCSPGGTFDLPEQ